MSARTCGPMVLLSFAVLVTAACGPDEPTTDPQGRRILASAAEVAEEARGTVRCPADLDTPAAAPGQPVSDILEVRPGLTWDEAANVILCAEPLFVVAEETGRGFNLETFGVTLRHGFTAQAAEAKVEMTGADYVDQMQAEQMARMGNSVIDDLKPGEANWYVTTMGMPHEERVVAAARRERYPEDSFPLVTSVEAALVAKYGPPSWRLAIDGEHVELAWEFGIDGHQLDEETSRASLCQPLAHPNQGVSLSPYCGRAIGAWIGLARDNPALASELSVGVTDHAAGYALLKATERALAQHDSQRRQAERQAAREKSAAPRL